MLGVGGDGEGLVLEALRLEEARDPVVLVLRDGGEIWVRCGGDTGEMQGRCRGDSGGDGGGDAVEIQGRYGGGMACGMVGRICAAASKSRRITAVWYLVRVTVRVRVRAEDFEG